MDFEIKKEDYDNTKGGHLNIKEGKSYEVWMQEQYGLPPDYYGRLATWNYCDSFDDNLFDRCYDEYDEYDYGYDDI